MAVGVIDDENVALGRNQGLGPFEGIVPDADRRPDQQAAEPILCRARILGSLEDVFVGDEPFKVKALIDHHDLLDLVLMKKLLGLLERGADGHRDELAGHNILDRDRQPGFEADVPVGQDADQLVVFVGDRQSRDPVLFHDLDGLFDLFLGTDRNGIDNHAAFVALDLVDLFGLELNRHVAVDDPHSALLGQGDSHAGGRHRVHSRADNGDAEGDIPAEEGSDVGAGGRDVGFEGDDEDVVKGQAFLDIRVQHAASFLTFFVSGRGSSTSPA